jgi:deoxyribonuclease V
MEPKINHRWDLGEDEAKKLQEELSKMVKEEKLDFIPRFVAGVDISYNFGSDILFAGVVILSYEDLSIVEKVVAVKEVKFKYIPGLLSFRETPAILEAFKKIKTEPDIIFVDGQGIAHPRFFGIASHIGLIYDKPSVGVAKSILVGTPDFIPKKKWEIAPLRFKGRVVGCLVCTDEKSQPIVVSVGHKITLQDALEIVKKMTAGFRIPEPTRLAHIIVNEARRKYGSKGKIY